MSARKIAELMGHEPDPRSVPASDMSATLYGIEVEIENCRVQPPSKYWRWTGDGSLRNNGKELVLRVPMGGDDLKRALEELREVFTAVQREQGSSIEVTPRCSVHCHIDFRDADLDQVISMFIGWVLFESAMYTVGGKDRYDSIFCPGVTNTQAQIRAASEIMADNPRVAEKIAEWPKYTGLNLSSLASHGSIEIRTHRGSSNPEEILRWVQLLDRLQSFCKRHAPMELVHLAQREREQLANKVFGDMATFIVCDNWLRYFDTNLRNAFDVLYYQEILALNKPEVSNDIEAMADAIIRIVRGEDSSPLPDDEDDELFNEEDED